MKPKKNLTKWSVRIIVKNPFTATMVATLGFNDVDARIISSRVLELHNSVELTEDQMNSWEHWAKWIADKKQSGWGRRRIYNFITKYFEMSLEEKAKLDKLTGVAFGDSPYKYAEGQQKIKVK